MKITTRVPARFWPKEAAHGARRARLIKLLELGEAAEAEAALKPFAATEHIAAEGYDHLVGDDGALSRWADDMGLTVGDVRKARAALSQTGSQAAPSGDEEGKDESDV